MVFYQAENHELSDYLEPIDGGQFLFPTPRSLKNASPLHSQLYIIDYHFITNEQVCFILPDAAYMAFYLFLSIKSIGSDKSASVDFGKSKAYFQKSKAYFLKSKPYFFLDVRIFEYCFFVLKS